MATPDSATTALGAEIAPQFLTLNLRLRTPSRHKQAALHRAMHAATSARIALMEEWNADPRIAEAAGRKLGRRERTEVARTLSGGATASHPALAPLPGPVRDGVREDCAMLLKSRLGLLAVHDEGAGVADLLPRPDRFLDGLEALRTATTRLQQDEARDLMATRARDSLRPLRFVRFRAHDGFLIVRDARDRHFLSLALGPSPRYRAGRPGGDLFDIRTGERVTLPGRAILFPLEFGVWHRQRLAASTPRSATLTWREGVFTLHVSVAVPVTPAPMAYDAIVGVDRGINMIAAAALVSAEGALIESHEAEGQTLRALQRRAEARMRSAQRAGRNIRPLRVRNAADTILHEAANRIVDLAARRGSFVAMEELRNITMGPQFRRPRGRARAPGTRALNRQLTRAQYAKLRTMVAYKLRLAGLVDGYGRPALVEVVAAGTSITCPECDHRDRASRSGERFSCTACGHTAHADANAARNIASRGFEAVKRMRDTAEKKGRTLLPVPILPAFANHGQPTGLRGGGQTDCQVPGNRSETAGTLRAGGDFHEDDPPKGDFRSTGSSGSAGGAS